MIRKKFHKILEINGTVFKLAPVRSYSPCKYCDVKFICNICGNICNKFNIDADYRFIYDTKEIQYL